jgi:hypothetical protein
MLHDILKSKSKSKSKYSYSVLFEEPLNQVCDFPFILSNFWDDDIPRQNPFFQSFNLSKPVAKNGVLSNNISNNNTPKARQSTSAPYRFHPQSSAAMEFVVSQRRATMTF